MDEHNRRHKRPRGWSKPYWAWAGLYVCVTLVSFLVSLILVGFICGVILRAAIPAEPIVWRSVEAVLDVLICVAVAWYFASQEGYTKRAASAKISVGGGLLFLLVQCPAALLFGGAPYVAGPLASTLAHLLYFGNQSIYADSIDSAPTLWVVGCMAVADGLVLIPAMAVGEQVGAGAYKKEQAALTGNAPKD